MDLLSSLSIPASNTVEKHNYTIELSIIVPTFKEIDNIGELVKRVCNCLHGIAWEIVFVDDDSPDGTADRVREMARTHSQVRCLHRIGRRGLSSACIEGMLSSAAPYVTVMDADLQHDETLLPKMLEILRKGDVDIVIGSRYIPGGSTGQWEKSRAWISRFATQLSRIVLKADLADPMSGFFMMRHDAMIRCVRGNLSGIGFKVLLDLFASSPQPLRFQELPYQFRERYAGESKLDTMVAWEYLLLLLDKLIGHIVPVRFIAFSLIGGLGVIVHLLVLTVVYRQLDRSFIVGQTTATLVAMTSNFFLNNFLTYRDRRLRGWGLLRGWISFTLACSIGAIANVGIAAYLFKMNTFWITSAAAGVLIGAVWNYAVTAFYTWQKS
jgi:dolichol-phosphate mannosyltransferase